MPTADSEVGSRLNGICLRHTLILYGNALELRLDLAHGCQILTKLATNFCRYWKSVRESASPAFQPTTLLFQYDVNKVDHDMAETLKNRGYEFRVTPRNNSNERQFWAKRSNVT